jgi:hypothetical protein
MINNVVGSDALMFIVIGAWSHGKGLSLRVSLTISGRATILRVGSIAIVGIGIRRCMRRRQRALAMISISCGRPLVILVVVRVGHSRAVRGCLSLIGSIGVTGRRAVAVLVTVVAMVAVVTWRGIQRMSRSVLVGVEGVTIAAVNRHWWWRRGVIGIFIVVIRDIGNSWQSHSASLGHLGQGAL